MAKEKRKGLEVFKAGRKRFGDGFKLQAAKKTARRKKNHDKA